MKQKLIFLMLSFAMTLPSWAGEVHITTAQGRGADNQIMGQGNDRQHINKGAASSFQIRANNYPGNNYIGVLRFDLSTGFVKMQSNIELASLSLNMTELAAPGTIYVYGLKDAFKAGPDDIEAAEWAEEQYAEGNQNWSPAAKPEFLTGDNAPGYLEARAGLAAFNWFGNPFMLLGELKLDKDTKPGAIIFTSPLMGKWLIEDTNGLVVIYLVSPDATATFTTKENKSDIPTLIIKMK